jgi:hypothetical protein
MWLGQTFGSQFSQRLRHQNPGLPFGEVKPKSQTLTPKSGGNGKNYKSGPDPKRQTLTEKKSRPLRTGFHGVHDRIDLGYQRLSKKNFICELESKKNGIIDGFNSE